MIELAVEGMTCASCAARVERKLNTLDGVTASVNYATEKAAVEFDPAHVSPRGSARRGRGDRLLGAAPAKGDCDGDRRGPDGAFAAAVIIAAALALPVLLMGTISALQFTYWQWLALGLATPVVLWAGWPFHLAAWKNLRHGAATMDTLISLGTLAAGAGRSSRSSSSVRARPG